MEFKVSLGPQHPALHEPISLRMTLDGEIIRDADLKLGYNHRGIEKLAESRTYIQNLYLTERICGICSFSHQTCYTQGVEKLMELVPAKRGALYPHPDLRAGAGAQPPALAGRGRPGGRLRHASSCTPGATARWSWTSWTAISGNRVHYSMNTFGGVRRDIDEMQKQAHPRFPGPAESSGPNTISTSPPASPPS